MNLKQTIAVIQNIRVIVIFYWPSSRPSLQVGSTADVLVCRSKASHVRKESSTKTIILPKSIGKSNSMWKQFQTINYTIA